MKVKLLHADDLKFLFMAYRVCTDTLDKLDDFDKNVKLVENSLKSDPPHNSPLKHIGYKFLLEGIPRSLLQEIARHTVGVAINVKSTRFTLHKMINEFDDLLKSDKLEPKKFVDKYFYLNPDITDKDIIEKWYSDKNILLVFLLRLKEEGYKNDVLKQFLSEDLKTTILMSISALALRHLFNLRLHKAAWKPFRELAVLMKNALPENHLFLYRDILDKNKVIV